MGGYRASVQATTPELLFFIIMIIIYFFLLYFLNIIFIYFILRFKCFHFLDVIPICIYINDINSLYQCILIMGEGVQQTHTSYSSQRVSPSAFDVIASNILTIIHDSHIYSTNTDACRHLQMCKQIHAHTHTHAVHPDFPSPSCAAVLRPCILMALMMLHAALGPLKVNSMTSVVSCSDR